MKAGVGERKAVAGWMLGGGGDGKISCDGRGDAWLDVALK